MAGRAELLFENLQSEESLTTLIGKPETTDFDCKVWPERADAIRGSLTKAACGFANATGGVIVIGLKAKGQGRDEPDVVQALAPVQRPDEVLSAALDIILNFVEPGVEGIRTATVPSTLAPDKGYILIFVPEQDIAPRRTKTDWKFYVRIAAGTVPMEYFQIEDRFGRRPHPRLVVKAQDLELVPAVAYTQLTREVSISITNEGRGLARFPALHCYKDAGLRHIEGGLLPYIPTWTYLDRDQERFSFRGGANDVLYPGETLTIARLKQGGRNHGEPIRNRTNQIVGFPELLFPGVVLRTSVICDGMRAFEQTFEWEEYKHVF